VPRPASIEQQTSFEWNRELFACVVDAYSDLLAGLPQVTRIPINNIYI